MKNVDKNLKNLNKEELNKYIIEARSTIFNLRIEIANRNYKNIANINKHRKNIARAMTIINNQVQDEAK